MCGLSGVIFGREPVSVQAKLYGRLIFNQILKFGQSRGAHATGVAMLDAGKHWTVCKAAIPASSFVRSRNYGKLQKRISSETTLLMGHTRYATSGSPEDNANNHPIIAGKVIMTHNGVISNADELFRRYKFKRDGEVDSEILARIGEDCLVDGEINTDRLASKLYSIHGDFACVYVSKAAPFNVIFAKGERPLECLYIKRLDALFYSSEYKHIVDAIEMYMPFKPGKTEPYTYYKLDANTMYCVNCSGKIMLYETGRINRPESTYRRVISHYRWSDTYDDITKSWM